MARYSLRRKVDLLFQDFITRAKYEGKVGKAVRKTMHYSQATMGQKLHCSPSYISDFECGIDLRPDIICGMWRSINSMNYEMFAKLSSQDYILYCIRVIANYATACHEADLDDDELVKKFLTKLTELYPEFAE